MVEQTKWFELWYSDGKDICPTYILLVTADETGNYLIKDPFKNYKIVFSAKSYEEVCSELSEDDFDLVEGRVFV